MQISIIIPVYNRPIELSRAILSVLNQSYADFELIIVDDCSSDNTFNIATKFSENDHRVKILRNIANGGACISRNNGIFAANNKYIAFLDSDDQWLPNYLMEMVNLIHTNPDCGAFYSDIGLLNNEGQITPTNTPYGIEGDISSKIFENMYLCTPTTLIVLREIALLVGGFDTEFTKGCNDDEFCIKIALNTRIKYLNKILAIFHIDAVNRISTNPIGQIQGFGKLLIKFKDQIIESQGYDGLIKHYQTLETKYKNYIQTLLNSFN